MARFTGPVCRLCRRDGTKLFLKGAKCFSEKCPIEKRNFPPGQHGQSRKVKKVVGYGLQLREKQKEPSASTSPSKPSSAPTTRRPPTRPALPANCFCSSLRRASTTWLTVSASR